MKIRYIYILILSTSIILGNCTEKSSTNENPETKIEKPKIKFPSKIESTPEFNSSLEVVGIWYVKHILMSKKYGNKYDYHELIFKDGNDYYYIMKGVNVSKDHKPKSSKLRKEGNKYYKLNSPSGDYVVIKNGELSLWDNEGLIPDYQTLILEEIPDNLNYAKALK